MRHAHSTAVILTSLAVPSALGAEIKVRRGRMNLDAAKQIELSGRFYLLVQVATSTYVDCNMFYMT